MDFLDDIQFDTVFNDESTTNRIADSVHAWEQQKQRTKRQRFHEGRPEITVPRMRLLKLDIRRSYSTMLTNVLNSNENSLLFGFFDSFFTPNAILKTTCYVQSNPVINEITQGTTNIFRFWCTNLSVIPDSIMKLQKSFVESSGNKIVGSFLMHATVIYDHPFPGAIEMDNITEPSGDVNSSEVIRQTMRVNEKLSTLALRSEPLNLATVGKFILIVDDEKRITNMEMSIDLQ